MFPGRGADWISKAGGFGYHERVTIYPNLVTHLSNNYHVAHTSSFFPGT